MSNQKKAALLGMPFGTATSRLRKAIIFALVERLGERTCYRCEKPIENIDEFSLEHITPWQSADNPKESFFNLKNISYSHLKCNSAAAARPYKKWASDKERNLAKWTGLRSDPNRYKAYLVGRRDQKRLARQD